MKIINRKNLVLSTALLVGGALSVAQPSQAAPRRDDDARQEKREVKRAKREVKRERQDVRQAETPAERRRERREVQQARQNVQRQREELRQERRQDRDERGYNRPGYNSRPTWNNRPANGGYGYGQSYTGTVTDVRSDSSFDVRIGGSTYNVYTNYDLPRGLSVGDQVRVSGVREGGNDIRQARVSVLRNR